LFPPARAAFANSLFTDYLAARLLAALLGTATIYTTYLIGKRLSGARNGLAAAAVMAFMPLHAVHSHYAAVDVPATFWVSLSLLGAVAAAESRRARWYVLSGTAAGFAAATKYNCGLVVLSILTAHVLSCIRERKTQNLRARHYLGLPALALVCTAAAFLLGTPGVLIATNEFWRDFSYEMRHTSTGHGLVFVGTGSGWWYHLSHNLRYGLTAPLLALSVCGAAYLAWKRRPAETALLAFAVVYYGLIGAFEVRFMRYLIPILPVLAVAAGTLLNALASAPKNEPSRRHWLRNIALVAGVLACVWSLVYTCAHLTLFTDPDPRDKALAWLLANARGESVGLTTVPWFYSPPVSIYNGGPQSEKAFWRYVGQSQFQLMVLDTDAAKLRSPQDLPKYFVISDFEYGDALRLLSAGSVPPAAVEQVEAFADFWRTLHSRYKLAAVFSKNPSLGPLVLPKRALPPHDWMYPYPTIRIYQRRT
jgi:4-amino-4-deoxy-L-arabinose transferase-like glycosyltransferase